MNTNNTMIELNATVVSDKGYTRGELETAFNVIADSANWKLPIDAVIRSELFEVCEEACVFFTGSKLKIVDILSTNLIRVTALGYYATIGA